MSVVAKKISEVAPKTQDADVFYGLRPLYYYVTQFNKLFVGAVNNLIDVLINLFAAGSDTTTATLCWGFLYLLKYPAVYAKWKIELEQVVGRGNLPTLIDRPK